MFFGGLYGLFSSIGGIGWWLFFYLCVYGIILEYFISYFGGSWFFYEYDCVMVNYERLEECLY